MSDQPFLSGVIEGFYGKPWSREQRRELFRWLQRAGLNTYMYAPKDDLKHRALWRAAYDEAELADLSELVRDCTAHGLNFIYAIAPGLDVLFTEASDRGALWTKVESVAALGVRTFALLFDDIPATLHPDDAAQFITPAAAQSDLANALWAKLSKGAHAARVPSSPARRGLAGAASGTNAAGGENQKAEGSGGPPDPAGRRPALPDSFAGDVRLLFCPTAYCGRMARPAVSENAYLRELGEKLAAEIDVFWTGPHIVSDTISVESIRELTTVLKRRPILWDNLLANDYDMRRLYLGPFAGRSTELREEVTGILLNPNCQFEANYVGVHTLGHYSEAGGGFTVEAAYARALGDWLGEFVPAAGEALTLDELRLLADLLHLPTESGPAAQTFLADLDVIRQQPPTGWGNVEDAVAATCVTLDLIYTKLSCLRNRPLFHALNGHAWELKEIGQFLQAWMAWRREHPDADARFSSPDFRAGVFRGGLGAWIERRFPVGGTNPPA